jgi:hypothetical protein
MKVLIACEESQAVCKAFRERGHEAYSCDILPCSGGHPEWHIQGDVLEVFNQESCNHCGIMTKKVYDFERNHEIYKFKKAQEEEEFNKHVLEQQRIALENFHKNKDS